MSADPHATASRKSSSDGGTALSGVVIDAYHARTSSQVAKAEAEIQRVATLLSAQPLAKGTGGKLETYIRRYCPDVLRQLVEAGVLAAQVAEPAAQ